MSRLLDCWLSVELSGSTGTELSRPGEERVLTTMSRLLDCWLSVELSGSTGTELSRPGEVRGC